MAQCSPSLLVLTISQVVHFLFLYLFSLRVLVDCQHFHESFTAYQQAIKYPSRISPSNTWHSIG